MVDEATRRQQAEVERCALLELLVRNYTCYHER